MGEFRGIADQVATHARGALDAQRLLALIRSGAADDHALLAALREVVERSEPYRLQGFARQLQKALQEVAR